MKIIKYQTLNEYTNESNELVHGIGECVLGYNEANLKLAKKEAYNGVYTIEDLDDSPQPSQLDVLEAQVTYTAMMTDTLLEV